MRIWRSADGEWQCLLVDTRLDFDEAGRPFDKDDDTMLCAASILRTDENRTPRAVLVSAPDTQVTVNGYRPLGVVVLRDRDVVKMGGETYRFGERTPTEPEPFPADDSELRCARCKHVLKAGELAIRCAACGAWHHSKPQSPEDDCFLYDPKCGHCGRARNELLWVPEDLDA